MIRAEPAGLIALLAGMRRASGRTQADIAEAMGTTQSAVSDLEGGRVEPRLSTLTRYAAACGVELDIVIRATVTLRPTPPQAEGDG